MNRISFLIGCLLVLSPVASFCQSWWAQETLLDAEGKLLLSDRSWWPRAQDLDVGESFVLRSSHDSSGLMIVRREVGTPVPYEDKQVWGAHMLQEGREMIVWILDDDGDMDPQTPEGDRDSDAYVADYGADGTVDRLLDYTDSDGDDDPDAQDIRYFTTDGILRHSIMNLDLDDDGQLYPTHDYQRLVGPQLAFLIDGYGDNIYFHNKYNPAERTWIPFSECPFAFHDLDGDGQTERVVRFSAAPMTFSAAEDPDFSNSWDRMMGPYEPMMDDMGVVNIRYTFDIDNGSRAEHPLHYEFAFNMLGRRPYDSIGTQQTFEKMRPPRTYTMVSHEETLAAADSFEADATGYTWREFEDGTIAHGDWRGRTAEDQRWEGIFWTWRRRFMHNTGGPNQHWNMRREYRPTAADSRSLYFSPVDNRLHLKGATEGWIPVGAVGNEKPIGSIRMFDTTNDGYFDRWEYYLSGAAEPYRVVSSDRAENRDFGDDWDKMAAFYTEELLPTALAENRRFIDRMRSSEVPDLHVPEYLSGARSRELTGGERLYVTDLIREHLYRVFTDSVRSITDQHLAPYSRGEIIRDTTKRRLHNDAWEVKIMLARWKAAYGRRDYASAGELYRQIVGRLPELL